MMYGGRPIGLNIHIENVLINNKLTSIHVVTLGLGLITLAEGREQNMNILLQNLKQLTSDNFFKNLIRESYREGKRMLRSPPKYI